MSGEENGETKRQKHRNLIQILNLDLQITRSTLEKGIFERKTLEFVSQDVFPFHRGKNE